MEVHEIVSLENLHVSQGWFDSSISFGEPGYEDRETIANGLEVAAKVVLLIALNQQASLSYRIKQEFDICSRAHNHAVNLHPIGALT